MNDVHLAHVANSWAGHHDGFEDPISVYATASEALFLLLLAVLFVAVWGQMRSLARRAAVAAGASAGLALLIGQRHSHQTSVPCTIR